MKRVFIFQEGTSRKFWDIDIEGSGFTVTYGKLGTAGQTSVKSFDSEDKCQKTADKLIAEKTKKGYGEFKEEEARRWLDGLDGEELPRRIDIKELQLLLAAYSKESANLTVTQAERLARAALAYPEWDKETYPKCWWLVTLTLALEENSSGIPAALAVRVGWDEA